MPTTTKTEAATVAGLLDHASSGSTEAATALTDVVALCTTDATGETLPLIEARALVGQAYIARKWAVWAVEECDKALEQLVNRVHFAEETEEFARIDAERGRDDAR